MKSSIFIIALLFISVLSFGQRKFKNAPPKQKDTSVTVISGSKQFEINLGKKPDSVGNAKADSILVLPKVVILELTDEEAIFFDAVLNDEDVSHDRYKAFKWSMTRQIYGQRVKAPKPKK